MGNHVDAGGFCHPFGAALSAWGDPWSSVQPGDAGDDRLKGGRKILLAEIRASRRTPLSIWIDGKGAEMVRPFLATTAVSSLHHILEPPGC